MCLFALLAIWLLRLAGLGGPPLLDSTEGRYAEISREMLANNEWIMPILDPGTPFWGKPPLWFWATSASFGVFGVGEFAARFASWAFSLMAMVAAMSLARRFHGRTAAVLTGVVLSTCVLYFAMMGGVLTDPALLFTVAITITGFARSLLGTAEERRPWGMLFFLGLGLGVLAKGLVGIVIPGAGIGLWLLLSGRWRDLRHLPWLAGMLLFAVVAVPWHLLAEWRSPGFLRYYIIGEHFLRFVDKGWEGDLYGNPHAEPKGMILWFAVKASLPWSAILPVMLWRFGGLPPGLKNDPLAGLMACCFVGPLLFFSLSDNVIITYCLPMLPAFAIVTALFLLEGIKRPRRPASPARAWMIPSQPRLVMATLAFALIANAGWLVGMSIVARKKSQYALVRDFRDARQSYTDELLYFRQMPFSAQFYSDGKSRLIRSDAEVLGQLRDDQRDWTAVDENDLDEFAKWSIDSRFEMVGRWGDHVVFREQ